MATMKERPKKRRVDRIMAASGPVDIISGADIYTVEFCLGNTTRLFYLGECEEIMLAFRRAVEHKKRQRANPPSSPRCK